ncbi:MAG: 2OG-Fe(II) oxygenase family protein [Myxococcota bacterium]
MLAPRLARPDVLAPLADAWRRHGHVRVESAFRESAAAAWLAALRGSEHTARFHVDPTGATPSFQLWRFTWAPGQGCDHPLCELGRWLHGDGVGWMSALTGLDLAAPRERELYSDKASKATFYDAYDEGGAGHALAFMLQLTPAGWPPEWGGHLELLGGRDGPVVERLAPAWNALDLFDVRRPGAWRRMPMIVKHLDGFAVSGWLPA